MWPEHQKPFSQEGNYPEILKKKMVDYSKVSNCRSALNKRSATQGMPMKINVVLRSVCNKRSVAQILLL